MTAAIPTRETHHLVAAVSFAARLRGWIARPPDTRTVIVLRPCDQIHTFFVAFPLDILYVDAAGRVLHQETLRPWRIGRRVHGAVSVYEAGAGVLISR